MIVVVVYPRRTWRTRREWVAVVPGWAPLVVLGLALGLTLGPARGEACCLSLAWAVVELERRRSVLAVMVVEFLSCLE